MKCNFLDNFDNCGNIYEAPQEFHEVVLYFFDKYEYEKAFNIPDLFLALLKICHDKIVQLLFKQIEQHIHLDSNIFWRYVKNEEVSN